MSLEQWMLAFIFMGEYQNETVEICDKLNLSIRHINSSISQRKNKHSSIINIDFMIP